MEHNQAARARIWSCLSFKTPLRLFPFRSAAVTALTRSGQSQRRRREIQRERGREGDRERGCVYVCVCKREKERGRQMGGKYTFRPKSANWRTESSSGFKNTPRRARVENILNLTRRKGARRNAYTFPPQRSRICTADSAFRLKNGALHVPAKVGEQVHRVLLRIPKSPRRARASN